MTAFFRVLDADNKDAALESIVRENYSSAYEIDPKVFSIVPGSPFAYWVEDNIRSLFLTYQKFESDGRIARKGLTTSNDKRYVRVWWETCNNNENWAGYAKGGAAHKFYSDPYCMIRWDWDRRTIVGYTGRKGRETERVECADIMGNPGLTWPLRSAAFSPAALPKDFVFSARGYVIQAPEKELLFILAVTSSAAFDYFFKVILGRFGFPEFIVGTLKHLPWPEVSEADKESLARLSRAAWSKKRLLASTSEVSRSFSLPPSLLVRTSPEEYNVERIEIEVADIQRRIDDITFRLYQIGINDRAIIEGWNRYSEKQRLMEKGGEGAEYLAEGLHDEQSGGELGEDNPDEGGVDADGDDDFSLGSADALLSWAIGVAFGRFDIRLATGERSLPPEPEPFKPLPARSPGMLPEGDAPFHVHAGILVDDLGHPHDLPDLIDRVLDRVMVEAEVDTRSWLRREFFPIHLKQYSKGGRKAPVYWPLSTASGGYTLWLYYPALTDQTLYDAANDFVGAKLDREVEPALRSLRYKTGRSSDEERALEELQTLHDELKTLRDELLRLAPLWKPNHDDGVLIAAAPLWRLFRHRPWQTVLRDTWEKLETGEYDWAHLAMTFWPERVREKCRTDRSLAIAHDLEDLYEPPPEAPAKAKGGRGRKKKG